MNKGKSDYIAQITLIAVFSFILVKQCFAQSAEGFNIQAPEPGTLALFSTTGILGYIVHFARRRFQQFKRCFDIVASMVGLIVGFPIIVLAAVIIKIVSPGPVFFKQLRVGQGAKVFKMYKLRTMMVDAEKDTGPVWAEENDSRLIKFGGLIRKTHIDELPQLVNVLRGEMSIIGPRPERPAFVEHLNKQVAGYKKRLQVKPGITGLAQVRLKYDETIKDVKRKIKLDLLYIRKMCLWVDMRILALTVLTVLSGRGTR